MFIVPEPGRHRDVTGPLTAKIRLVYEIVEDEKAMV